MRASRRNLVAVIVAAVMLVVSAAVLVWGISSHRDADATLHKAETTLAHERSLHSAATAELEKEQAAARGLRLQMDAVTAAADAVAPLDDQGLTAVKAAVSAGTARDVAGYNAAVVQLNVANPRYDAALEELRVRVNTLVVALDLLRN